MADELVAESRWLLLQRRFLEPTVPIDTPEERLEAAMLSGFLLVIFVAATAMALNPNAPIERRILTTCLAVACMSGYALHWTRYYWLMGWAAVASVTIPPFTISLLGVDPNDSLKWLAIPLLTGGLWLSSREFRYLYIVLISAIVGLPLLGMIFSGVTSVGYQELGQVLIFLSLVSLLIITSIAFRKQSRNRIENQNRALEKEIHERKLVEAELQEHQLRLEELVEERTAEVREHQRLIRGILDHAPAVIYVKDGEGKYRMINERLTNVIDRPHDEVIGKTDFDLFPEDIAVGLWKNDKRVIDTGEVIEMEEVAFLGGEARTFLSLKFPLLEASGKSNLLCGISTDITVRKRDEERLRKALSEVEELKNRLQAENIYLQEEIRLDHNFAKIISKSKILTGVLTKVEQAAKTDATVLILGETGTGKELIAHAVHNVSNRKDRPLVRVNCAALPDNLIESELFGHEKGAFTGATDKKIGRFELANEGTIFLDEIGDLPLALQVKLLRVLQEGEIERLGNPNTIRIDARVIAATNRNLKDLIEKNEFREDLYYRLNVIPIECPPLRERKEDIPLLVTHFLAKHGARIGKRIEKVSQGVLNQLMAHNWPGNVRELENLIERAMITSPGAELVLSDWGTGGLRQDAADRETPYDVDLMAPGPLHDAVTKFKQTFVANTLKQTGGVQKKAAKILDIQATYLSRMIKDLDIKH